VKTPIEASDPFSLFMKFSIVSYRMFCAVKD
jgi:hypothetical protein